MSVEKHLESQYSETEIADIASQLDITVIDGKTFIGVESLCHYLKAAGAKAMTCYMISPPGKEKHTHLEAWGAYTSLSHVFKKAGEYVKRVLTEKRKERAERNW